MTPAGPRVPSLDDEVLWPILDRVARGTITVRPDKHGWPWYYDGDRHIPFSGYLLDKLTEQRYVRWDSMIQGLQGLLVVRDDGTRRSSWTTRAASFSSGCPRVPSWMESGQRAPRRRHVVCRPCAVAAGGRHGRSEGNRTLRSAGSMPSPREGPMEADRPPLGDDPTTNRADASEPKVDQDALGPTATRSKGSSRTSCKSPTMDICTAAHAALSRSSPRCGDDSSPRAGFPSP